MNKLPWLAEALMVEPVGTNDEIKCPGCGNAVRIMCIGRATVVAFKNEAVVVLSGLHRDLTNRAGPLARRPGDLVIGHVGPRARPET